MPLEGIPEGVEVVRYGPSRLGDWYLQDGELHQGTRDHVLVVRPALGCEFRFNGADNRYKVIIPLTTPRSVRVNFRFTNGEDAKLLDRLREMPGFVDLWEVGEGGKTARAGDA